MPEFESLFQQRRSVPSSRRSLSRFRGLEAPPGYFPVADHAAVNGSREVMCVVLNDYLGMGQHPAVIAAMPEVDRRRRVRIWWNA